MFTSSIHSKYWTFLLLPLVAILFTACNTPGCTDPKANNFLYEANKDDGSCDYGGCTDLNALNYNPDAQYNNGTCLYNGGVHFITNRSSIGIGNTILSAEVSGQYIGSLSQPCLMSFPTCETSCEYLAFTDKSAGRYAIKFWEIRLISSTVFDTIYESTTKSFQVTGNECNIITIE